MDGWSAFRPHLVLPDVLLGVVLALLSPASASADLLDTINALRAHGCGDQPATPVPLVRSAVLDQVAQTWSSGGELETAFAATQYRFIRSASKHIGGVNNDREIVYVLEAEYCDKIASRTFTEIGLYQRPKHVWLVLTLPATVLTEADAPRVRERVLALVNEARRAGRTCGSSTFGPAGPVGPAPLLDDAARVHSLDMAAHDELEHRGSDGTSPAQRVTAVGYAWQDTAENISSGAWDADSVVEHWLASPGHCANIMNPVFTQMGVAYVVEPKARPGIYWTQVFADPQPPPPPKPQGKSKRRSNR